MEKNTSDRQHAQAIEEAYRRGYHHGFARVRELLLRLLSEGMPPFVALELCRVFEEHIIVPWRKDAGASSAPPVFDVEECQRLLRADKEREVAMTPTSFFSTLMLFLWDPPALSSLTFWGSLSILLP